VVVDTVEQSEYNRLEQLLRGVVHTIMATRRVDVGTREQRHPRRRYRQMKHARTAEICKPSTRR
jgi:hypothetical protein